MVSYSGRGWLYAFFIGTGESRAKNLFFKDSPILLEEIP
jgi:hypothetical protein